MRKESSRFASGAVFEGMTSIRAILHAKENGINDRTILQIRYDQERAEKNVRELSYLRAMGSRYDFPVTPATPDEIAALSTGNSHGGILALCAPRTICNLSDSGENIKQNGFYAYVEGIEDPYNFGYAIRSLYACGVDGIILGERDWMTAAGVVCRASAGASESVPLYRAEPIEALHLFKALHYEVIAADTRTDLLLGTTPLKKPLLLIAGGEKRGISRSVLNEADKRIRIPYARDFHAALSAASAITMFAYEILRQTLPPDSSM